MSLRPILESIRTSGWTYLLPGLLIFATSVHQVVSQRLTAVTGPGKGLAVALGSCIYLAIGTIALRLLARRGAHTRLVATVWLVLYGGVGWALAVLAFLQTEPSWGSLYRGAGLTMFGALGAWFGLGLLTGYIYRIS